MFFAMQNVDYATKVLLPEIIRKIAKDLKEEKEKKKPPAVNLLNALDLIICNDISNQQRNQLV